MNEQSQCNTCANYCERKEEPATPQEMMGGFVLYVAPCTLLCVWMSQFPSLSGFLGLGIIIFGFLLSSGMMLVMRPFSHLWQNKNGE